jgi:hypothetical protein
MRWSCFRLAIHAAALLVLAAEHPAEAIPPARQTDRFVIMAYPMTLRPKMPYCDPGRHHRDSMHLHPERIVAIRQAGSKRSK